MTWVPLLKRKKLIEQEPGFESDQKALIGPQKNIQKKERNPIQEVSSYILLKYVIKQARVYWLQYQMDHLKSRPSTTFVLRLLNLIPSENIRLHV